VAPHQGHGFPPAHRQVDAEQRLRRAVVDGEMVDLE